MEAPTKDKNNKGKGKGKGKYYDDDESSEDDDEPVMAAEEDDEDDKDNDKCAQNYYNDDKYYDKYCEDSEDDDEETDEDEDDDEPILAVEDEPTMAPTPAPVVEDAPIPTPPPMNPLTSRPTGILGTGGVDYPPIHTGDVADRCIFCDDPEYVANPNLSVDGILCTDWQVVAWTNPSYEDCLLLRATAVAKCGCPFQIDEDDEANMPSTDSGSIVCENICGGEVPDAIGDSAIVSRQYEEFKQLPNSELTCADVMTFPAVDGDETCRVIEETYGAWCGCSETVPPCTLCENELPPARPNAKFSRSSETCGSIADTVSTITSSRCAEFKEELVADLGYDVYGFCGCLSEDYLQAGIMPGTGGNTGGNFVCQNPCPEGSVYAFEREQSTLVPDWNAPCADWPNRFPFVQTSALCEDLQNNVVGPYCCNVDEANPAPAPTGDSPSGGGPSTAAATATSGGDSRISSASLALVSLLLVGGSILLA